MNLKTKTIAMRKHCKLYLLLIAANIFSIIAFGQNTTINGSVKNSATGEPDTCSFNNR